MRQTNGAGFFCCNRFKAAHEVLALSHLTVRESAAGSVASFVLHSSCVATTQHTHNKTATES